MVLHWRGEYRYLAGMYAARNLEDALAAPLETGELLLDGLGLDRFPMEIMQLPHLRLLDLGNNLLGALPPELGQLQQLEVLILKGNALRRLPPEIAQLQRLHRLDLDRNQLQALPDALQYCEGLCDLRISQNSFVDWPASALPPTLESLSISRNALTQIPEHIRHLPHLRYLDLSFNRLTALPHAVVLLEALDHLLLAGNPLTLAIPTTDPEGDLAQVIKELRRSKVSATEQVRWFRLLQGDATLRDDEAPYLLAAALDSPVAQVRQAARSLLPQWFASPLPARGPADMVFLGAIAQKSKYQKALQAAGFHVFVRADAQTIVVLGERPGQAAKQAFAAGAQVAYEGHLEEWWKADQGEFLAGKATEHPMTASLRRLIRSYRKENIEMAFVMMQRAGIPKELLTDMLAIKLFHTDPEVKAKAAEAFAQLADKPLQGFVDRQIAQHFLTELPTQVLPLVQALLRHAQLDGSSLVEAAIDLAAGHAGLVLLLPEAARQPHFQRLLIDGRLDLSGLRIPQFPTALAALQDLRYLLLSRNQVKELPADLQAFAKLEMLDLAENEILRLPDGIGALRALKGLDLSHNRLQQLPDQIGQMQALEALRLDHNPLQDLPAAMQALPQLEMLGLFGCRFRQFPSVVWDMTRLKSLDLGDCQLSALPATIPGFPLLESLGLRDNPISHLPAWVGELPRLRFLDVSLLPALQLPESLRGHTTLERIYLIRDESMDFAQVLDVLETLPRLRYAYFRGRKIVRAMQLRIEERLPRVRVAWGG